MPPRNVVILKSLIGAKGGLEKYTLRLAKAFYEQGCRVIILTTVSKKRPIKEVEYATIVPLFNEGFFSFLNVCKFAKKVSLWLKNHPSSCVFGLDRNEWQTHYRAGNGVHAAYLKRRKLNEGFFKYLSFLINPLHRIILRLEKKTFEDPKLQCLFTNSFLIQKEILDTYKISKNKIQVVHNGVEWEEYSEFFTNQSFFQEGSYRLLFIGNGYKRKGLDILLKALSKIEEPFILSVVGKDKNIKKYKEMAKKLRLTHKVQFFGPQNDINSFYMENEALLIPSIYDPFANVTLEALAMGLSVLSSLANGASEILKPYMGVIVNDIYDEKEFIDSIKQLMKQRKTKISAERIRNSVKDFDFKNQLFKIVDHTLCHTQDTSSTMI